LVGESWKTRIDSNDVQIAIFEEKNLVKSLYKPRLIRE